MAEVHCGQVAVRKPRFSHVGIGEIGAAFTLRIK